MTKAGAIAVYKCLAWHEGLAKELTEGNLDEALHIFESIADLRLLESQITLVKRSVKSENSDYLTGYLCACARTARSLRALRIMSIPAKNGRAGSDKKRA